MADLHSPPKNKAHTWILVLLFWIVALLVFVAGYLIYGKEGETPILSGAELATQCTAAGFVDAATVPDSGEMPACPEPEDEVVEGTSIMPGFKYPAGWHVTGSVDYEEQEDGTFATMQTTVIHHDPIFYCGDCDGPAIDIRIRTGAKDEIIARGSIEDHTEAYLLQFKDGEIYSDIATSYETLPNGTLAKVIGEQDGLWQGKFETWVFEGDETMSIVTFTDNIDDSMVDDDGWMVVETSLDFSTLK